MQKQNTASSSDPDKGPSFQLVDSGWDGVMADATALRCSDLRFVSPFIKVRAAKRLLTGQHPTTIQVITRFHPGEMCAGVNDTQALRLLLEAGAKIRGIRGLHAKLYLFGDRRAIVTSANLTEAALLRNHEFGFVTSENDLIKRCREYFDALWQQAGADLDLARLEGWERKIAAIQLAGRPPAPGADLKDEGTEVRGLPREAIVVSTVEEGAEAYVKFFGQTSDRAPWDMSVLQEVEESGSHWACTYPANKRPRTVQDGDVMFMGRLVENPSDTVIYGRATAISHVEGRDEASPQEISDRAWKATWPAYVRVHSGEFVAGTLNNGVRLSALMDALQSQAFTSTQENAQKRMGNQDPRRSLGQKAHVHLTRNAFLWLNESLQEAFDLHGKLAPAELATLDWPEVRFLTVGPPSRLNDFQQWLVDADGKAVGTAKIYARFLTRCAEHYGEVINEKTLKSDAQADAILARVSHVVAERDRWAPGTFNVHDITDNLNPALRAYARFASASST